jgi:Cu/Ag efflux pump CusA
VIHRESVARHVDVTADVVGRDLAELNAEVEDRIRREVGFPLEYRAEVLGAHANQVAATRTARGFAVAGLVAIVLLLQAAFGNWRLAIFFSLSLPVALLGGVLAALASGSLGSLGSVLGLVAVFGIAARWGMTLVSHYRHLEGRDGAGFSSELIQRATGDRFAPMVTSAIAVALAFLPLAVLGGDAGREILHPMALAVLGGLVTTLLVSLFVLPSLYLRFGAEREADVIVEE